MTNNQKTYINYIKRPFGFFGALMALTVTCPIILVISIILLLANKNGLKGIFFVQNRPGKDEKIFRIFKFKTMTDERDSNGNLLPDSQRLTKIGKFVRATSMDELPQLFNILTGDMAFIGPRPLRVHYLPLYSPEQHRRHEVTPGISGWAQIHGRNNISWTEKFQMDVWYVDNISLKTDVIVFFTTIKKVFMRDDINNKAVATMYPFDGTN